MSTNSTSYKICINWACVLQLSQLACLLPLIYIFRKLFIQPYFMLPAFLLTWTLVCWDFDYNTFTSPFYVPAIIWFSKSAVFFEIWRLCCSLRYIKCNIFCIFFDIILIYSFQQSCCFFLYVLYIFRQGGNNMWFIKRDFEGVILTFSVIGVSWCSSGWYDQRCGQHL